MDYFTSDLHFNHDKPFIFKERGFETVKEMNEAIINNFNKKIGPEDSLYILGDVVIGDVEDGIGYLSRLPGKKYIIIGNHDSEAKVEMYNTVPSVTVLGYGYNYKYSEKKKFFLSHYPCCTENFSMEEQKGKKVFTKPLAKLTINLSGHTHSKELWDNRTMSYNVAVDAHNMYPVSIEEIIEDCRNLYMDNNSFN